MKYNGLEEGIINGTVAPHAGAWIEMEVSGSLDDAGGVAPHAGAWIEMEVSGSLDDAGGVAPHAGAWIEIELVFCSENSYLRSLPTRERGLKCTCRRNNNYNAPRRSPRGSVD